MPVESLAIVGVASGPMSNPTIPPIMGFTAVVLERRNLGASGLALILYGLAIVFLVFAARVKDTSRSGRERMAAAGRAGERRVSAELRSHVGGVRIIDDLYLRFGQRIAQIDHVVAGSDRIFVLETKNWRGRIECGADRWMVNGRGRHSPIRQNGVHVTALRNAVGDVPAEGVVVMASSNCVLSNAPSGVVPLTKLSSMLGGYPKTPASDRSDAFGPQSDRRVEKAWRRFEALKADRKGQRLLAAKHGRIVDRDLGKRPAAKWQSCALACIMVGLSSQIAEDSAIQDQMGEFVVASSFVPSVVVQMIGPHSTNRSMHH